MKSKKKLLNLFLLGSLIIVPSVTIMVGCSISNKKWEETKAKIKEIKKILDEEKPEAKEKSKDEIEELEIKREMFEIFNETLKQLQTKVYSLEEIKPILEKQKVRLSLLVIKKVLKKLESDVKKFKAFYTTLTEVKILKEIEETLKQLEAKINWLETFKKKLED